MKVIRRDDAPEEDATDAPIFVGGKVTRRPLVSDGLSEYYNFNIVEFAPGARNKFHTHSSDQVLFVTKGRGIVSTETASWSANFFAKSGCSERCRCDRNSFSGGSSNRIVTGRPSIARKIPAKSCRWNGSSLSTAA